MSFDHIFRDVRIAGDEDRRVDIGVLAGRFAAVGTSLEADGPETRLDGRLVLSGFVETHIHLDKSRIMDRRRVWRGHAGRCGRRRGRSSTWSRSRLPG